MRLLIVLLSAMTLLVFSTGPASAVVVQVDPLPLAPGKPALVKVCPASGLATARIQFMDRDFPLFQSHDGCLYGFVCADLGTKPGEYTLRVYGSKAQAAAAEVKLRDWDYGVRRITVDPKFMQLTPEQLAWHKRDKAAIAQAYAMTAQERLWSGGFVMPRASKLVGPFGRRSIINGEPRSSHGGIDLRGKKGAPVAASGDGRVVLVRETFFGGLTVIVDHGQGLMTRYLHLAKALVTVGQDVRRGQDIGQVGMSGRVTGPHLHFDVRYQGVRLDPQAWITLSGRLAGVLGD